MFAFVSDSMFRYVFHPLGVIQKSNWWCVSALISSWVIPAVSFHFLYVASSSGFCFWTWCSRFWNHLWHVCFFLRIVGFPKCRKHIKTIINAVRSHFGARCLLRASQPPIAVEPSSPNNLCAAKYGFRDRCFPCLSTARHRLGFSTILGRTWTADSAVS